MAHAAVVSLIQILKQLMFSDEISIPCPESLIESLHSKACSLKALLGENSSAQSRAVDDLLESQIRDAFHKAEDIIESHISKSEQNSADDDDDKIFTHKLQELLQELDSIEEKSTVNDTSIARPVIPDSSRRPSFPTAHSKLVGLNHGLSQMKVKLVGESSQLSVVAVVGMAGIGKTTLAREVYRDPSIGQFFHFLGWATVDPTHGTRDILVTLLDEDTNYSQLTESMYKNLKGRRYLIVLDGLSDTNTWDDLKNIFPNDDNGSRIVLTTRLRNVALHGAGNIRNIHETSFLDNDESWDLLRGIVFNTKPCPRRLVKIGKTIAENCQGLPLTIVLVGAVLSAADKTLTYWEKVADSPIAAIYDTKDADLISAMQFLNDDNLPRHLKAFFLYMGVFPLNYEIPVSKLVKVWVSEGFVLEEAAGEACLEELVGRSLVLVHKTRSRGGIKTCSVHSAVWHMCVNAADKEKFFCAFSRQSTKVVENDNGRRICIRKNILFAISDVYEEIASVSNARSLLCNGLDYPYPLPECFRFRLLRVMDVLSIRFYEFPMEILKLVRLRYLALTCNGCEIPDSLGRLRNLQVLIVRHHSRIKSYSPIEIWNMKHLRHVRFMGLGGDLRDPRDGDRVLKNLLTLSNVTGRSVSEGVLKGTPNLNKLGVCIEVGDPPSCFAIFDRLALLVQLESFKCIIVNPSHDSLAVLVRPISVFNFPTAIKKITLNGCRLPWEDIRVIARLPNLQVLKLRCYAFEGPEWELDEDDFGVLKYLLLEDLDLERWTADSLVLKRLERLIIRHCYNLNGIPEGVDYVIYLQLVELVHCGPLLIDSGLRIKEMQEEVSNDEFQLLIDSSWKERSSHQEAFTLAPERV